MPARSVQILWIVRANQTVPWCNSENVIVKILTVSNADGLYVAYDPTTALNGPYQCGSIGREVTQLSIW